MVKTESLFRRTIALLIAMLMVFAGLQVLTVASAPAASAASGEPGSISFGNSSKTNYLTYPKNPAFGFGTSNFTIEYWWKPTVAGRSDVLDFKNQTFGETDVTRLDLGASIVTGKIELYTDGGCALNSGKSVVLNKWVHIALTRNADSLYLWIDGIQSATVACNKNFGTAGYQLQLMYENGGGNLSNVRVVKGTAVYTESFAPSTAPLSKVVGTSLLLNSTQGADFLKDSSDNNLVASVTGSPSSSTSVPTLGSVCFDNSSAAAYIDLASASNAVGTGDFTLETWLKLPSASAALTLVNGHSANNGTSSLNLFFNGQPGASNSHVAFSTAGLETKWGGIGASTWAHVAYVRQNSTGKLYLNGAPSTNAAGSQDASVADVNNYTSSNFKIGFPLTGAWPAGFTGCLAGTSLTKSALYTSNFSTNLPYPQSRSLPANSVVFLKATADGFVNSGSGAAPTASGAVTYSAELPAAPITIASASISGTAVFGEVLTASAGAVSNASTFTTTYQWLRAGVAIPGQVSSTYTLTSADITKTISATVTVSSGGQSAAATSPGTVSVTKATPTFTWSGFTKTYGDANFTLPSPSSSTPGTFTYSSATPVAISLSGSTATVAGAGSSVITATFTPTDSVNFNSGGTTTITITVQRATLSITASSPTATFGDAAPAITPIYAGFVNRESSSAITAPTCSTAYTDSSSAGTSPSTSCTGASATNYSFSYSSGAVTVLQAGQTSALTISSTIATYGTNLSLTTSGGSGSGTNSFVVDSGPCTVSGSTLTSTGAGTCMVTATKAANGNYLIAHSASTAVTVSPKNLTISGLSGVNKEFNNLLSSSATGTPTLVGVVGSDNVLLDGTPIFTFATSDAENGKTVTAAGFTLAGTTAINYTLTQPTLTANITKKAARVTATDLTVAVGGSITAAFATSGFIAGDAISSASYTYSGTGTSSAPTAVGVYTITPSNAVYGSGSSGNYSITYEAATLTILDKYTVIYNANGGLVASNATASVDFSMGHNALALPTPTRSNFTFTGWHTLQINGYQITGAYTPTASVTLWAHWVQNSLYGMGANTKILTITTLIGVGNTYSASAGGGTIAIQYLADALPAGTVIDAYVLADTSNAASVIGAGNNYVMSLVLAWLAPDGTVPTTAPGKAISMTITNASIKRGAKIFSVIGSTSTLLGVAAVDGSATVSITDDPQIFIAITRPDAPTAISATSGGNESSIITWSAPTSDGGSAITGYTVTASTGQTCTSATTTCSMVGLTNGTAYTFTVKATNAIGISDVSSVSLLATPAALIVVTAPAPAPSTGLSSAEQVIAEAKALAELKAAKELAAAIAAEAARVAALASRITVPNLTLYSISASLKLGARDTAYLKKYVATLRSSTIVTCIGYVYAGKASAAKAKAIAVTQATALCKTIKAFKMNLKTSIVTYASNKAPVAAKGSKWVAVSYRVDASRVL